MLSALQGSPVSDPAVRIVWRASAVSDAAAAPRPTTSPIVTIHPPSISKAS